MTAAPRKLSFTQANVLRRMAAHAQDEGSDGIHEAREIADWTGGSSDGVAYTLRSLVRRGLVEIARHDGDSDREAGGYKLTLAGTEEAG